MLKLATKFAPARAAFEAAYHAGFRHAELWLGDRVLAAWQIALRQARDYPNSYVLHFPNQMNVSTDALDIIVSLCRELGCRCMVIHQSQVDKYHEELLRREPGLRLAVENHKLSDDNFNQWAKRNPHLTLDVEHLWKFTLADAPLDELLARLRVFLGEFGNKLRHVHLPGYWPGFDEHRPMYCAREMILPVLSLLEEFGFEGLIVSESDLEYQTPGELRMDVLLFDAWRARAAS